MSRKFVKQLLLVLLVPSFAAAQDRDTTLLLTEGTWVCETEADARRAARAQQRGEQVGETNPSLLCGRTTAATHARILEHRPPLVAMIRLLDDPAEPWFLPRLDIGSGLVTGVPDRATALDQRRLAGRRLGEEHGSTVGTGTWYAVGFLGGLWAPVVGAGVAVAVAGSDDAQPVFVPTEELAAYPDMGLAFEEEFRRGYKDAALAKRRRSALFGGITSSALWIAALVAVASSLSAMSPVSMTGASST